MEIRQLTTFQTIVQRGSFLRAAEALDVAQSTVTLHVQQLEAELGVQLFTRQGRRMQLTEAGRTFEEHTLIGEASRRLVALLDAASVNGEYLFDGLDRRFNLGLFRGISGVGYSCLRQISSLVPSVLIWE